MDHQKAQQVLLDTAAILDYLDVPYFLIQGTALGAYRDKGFTPTERDIDIGILFENFKPLALIKEFLLSGYDIEAFANPIRTVVLWKDCIHIDLVGFLSHGDKRYTYGPKREWIKESYALVHDAELLETYEHVELFGKRFFVPSPIETYLEREYGDWKTPREDHVSRTRVYGFVEAIT